MDGDGIAAVTEIVTLKTRHRHRVVEVSLTVGPENGWGAGKFESLIARLYHPSGKSYWSYAIDVM